MRRGMIPITLLLLLLDLVLNVSGAPVCANDQTWTDKNGDNCVKYESAKWCDSSTPTGYGSGWAAAWGTFGDLKNSKGVDAMAACCACACGSDIVLVVDVSDALDRNDWGSYKNYVKERAQRAVSGSRGTHVSIIAYSAQAEIQCGLANQKSSLGSCADRLSRIGGQTNTANAIALASQYLQGASSSSRRRVIEVLTCGESSNPAETLSAAQEAQNAGLKVIAIGIGVAKKEELESLASAPKANYWTHVWQVERLQNLVNVLTSGCSPSFPDGAASYWGCADDTTWTDRDGNGCATYLKEQWCDTTADGYGSGWDPARGTFADLANSKGVDATGACCACACGSDVMIVVGASAQNSNWGSMRGFLRSIVDRAGTSVRSTNIGFITYTDTVALVCDLSFSTSDLRGCVSGLQLKRTPTVSMAAAISFASEYLQKNSVPYRRRVIQVLLDGMPSDVAEAAAAAQAAQALGLTVIAIGVGNQVEAQALEGLASAPKVDHWTKVVPLNRLINVAVMLTSGCVPSIPNGGTTDWELVSVYTDIKPSPSPIGCPDDLSWTDVNGDGCAKYVAEKWCDSSSVDGYGSGWDTAFGTFANRANAAGVDATASCCACARASDTLILVDCSDSIEGNWKLILEYLEDRIKGTVFSNQRGNHIGVVSYADGAKLSCDLVSNEKALIQCVRKMKKIGGATNTAAAIEFATNYLNSVSASYRRRVVEVVTGGACSDPARCQQAARQCQQGGLGMIAIGCGAGIDVQELSWMASAPQADSWTHVRSWDRLHNVAEVMTAGTFPLIPNGAVRDWEDTPPSNVVLVRPSPSPMGCFDDNTWADKNGDGCAKYVSEKWCDNTNDDGYGSGWNDAWGTFTDLAKADGIDATSACCACACASDVMLVVDRSGSIGTRNWQLVEQFLRDRVSSTNFTNKRGNHMGIVAFSTKANLICELSSNADFLMKCIRRVQYTGGFTYMADAIELATNYLRSTSSPHRRRVLEVLTDGVSTNPPMETQQMAQAAKDEGMTVVAIGVGTETDAQELQGLASEPKADHWTNINSWDRLLNAAGILAAGCVPRIPDGATTDWDKTPPATIAFTANDVANAVDPVEEEVDCVDKLETSIGWMYKETIRGTAGRPYCSFDVVREELQAYQCSQPDPECAVLYCDLPIPEEIIDALSHCAPQLP